jgi:hypothetical protein
MCWARSKIPLEVWRAGDANSNLIESVHADVNREGKSCTLVGGVTKGQYFDAVKMKTIQVINLVPLILSYSTNIPFQGYRRGWNSAILSKWPSI